jgi:tetratricopeptide (TPR) repeat protein
MKKRSDGFHERGTGGQPGEDRVAEPVRFGVELRRRRLAADVSLARLAESVHYSKGYLSRIETGRQGPTSSLAVRCDAFLEAGGQLAALVPPDTAERHQRAHDRRDAMDLNRRSLLAAGSALTTSGLFARPAFTSGTAPVDAFHELFGQMRRMGQVTASDVMSPILVAQTRVVAGIAAQAGATSRVALLNLAARFAEYTGWIAQESGDDAGAGYWTGQAVELADAAGESALLGYAWIRHALITMYRNDGAHTIALARRAQSASLPAEIREQAARREAQGHALLGDHKSAMTCLDRARELRTGAAAPTTASLGPTHLPDAVEMVTGWCLFDVGRPREAASILDRQLAALPPGATRSRARYGMRAALAHAAAGQIGQACALATTLLDAVDAIDSATVDTDLRRLGAELGRFRAHPTVKALLPRLSKSLHRSAR